MKTFLTTLLALALAHSVSAEEKAPAAAKGEKAPKIAKTEKAEKADKYQVTGPVIEVTDTTIVVEGRGKERHEFARNADTKVDGGDLKVGSKVTVKYTMTAASVEVKK
jgi:hypothetical protein